MQDIRFLTYSGDKWCDFDEYKKFKMLINDLKVVNDVAERGVRLMEEFKDVLTDDEEQRRMLLHCVEDTRKLLDKQQYRQIMLRLISQPWHVNIITCKNDFFT